MLDPHCVVFERALQLDQWSRASNLAYSICLIQIGMADVAGICGGHEEQDIDLEWPYTRL